MELDLTLELDSVGSHFKLESDVTKIKYTAKEAFYFQNVLLFNYEPITKKTVDKGSMLSNLLN